MKQLRNKKTLPESEIPVHSMPDIAFLLVVYFLLTAAFVTTRGLEFPLPEAVPENLEASGEPTVVVQIDSDGMQVNCNRIDEADLIGAIAGVLEQRPGEGVVLHVAPDASYSRMIAVYDRIVDEGVQTGRLKLRDIYVPTQADLQAYREAFDVDPFAAFCLNGLHAGA